MVALGMKLSINLRIMNRPLRYLLLLSRKLWKITGIDAIDRLVIQRAPRATDPPHTPRDTVEQIAVGISARAEPLIK